MSARARLVELSRRYGWALLAPAFTLVSAFLMNAVASRGLGPAGFGQFAVASTIVTLLGIAMALGMPTTIVALAGRRSRGVSAAGSPAAPLASEQREYREHRAAAIGLVWLAGLALTLLLLFLELVLGGGIARWFPRGTAAAIGAASLGTALLDVALADMQHALRFRAYFARMVGASLLRLAGVAGGILLVAPTARAAIWGYAVATALTGVALSATPAADVVRGWRATRPRLVGAVVRVMAFGAPVLGSSIVVAAMSWVDTLVLAGRLSAGEVGLYAAAARLTIIPSTLIGGMTSIALPLAARAWREGTLDDYRRRAGLGGTGVGIAVVAALALAAPLVVRLVFGAAFAPSAAIFVVLLVGFLPNFPGNPLSQLLYAAGRTRLMLAIHCLQLTATLVGLALLMGRVGLLEIAWFKTAVNVVAMAFVIGAAMRLPARAALPARHAESVA